MDIAEKLNYAALIDEQLQESFMQMHASDWDAEIKINGTFTLRKIQGDLINWQPESMFDLIYFDAFGPDKQPEMWSEAIFSKLYKGTNHNGILTTYSAKGTVRRTLQSVGFSVERIPGPPGKNHITRAIRKEE
jgi:tRNA U34 5-methylaminomethyl-2-thiouridine-forming methyltransferase MnmC